MKKHKLPIGLMYILLCTGGIMLSQIQLFFVALLIIIWIGSWLFGRGAPATARHYYSHLTTTCKYCTLIMALGIPMMFGATFIQYQLNEMVYPTVEYIAQNPVMAGHIALAVIQMFGLLCLGMLGLLAFRTYKCLVPLFKEA
ncbi:hypothetical protein HPY09_20530 (plasmid) [Vibrio cholerae]|uniref:hypothetical protein n=1 Tax=Vibrio cholerae TaxID=666 RepID=UPI00118249F0|nr:hypothetical protein [Vibrio cholerae]EJL6460701.1 hypothetical protein [Vibrio cholerae]MBJ6953142.1 hypothetical protein [Vibrio cholerae]MVC22361.1 hypothetical protein [Vibrio cholerae]QKU73327.1 hypothetical protein HPY09_20530 [Vibrio cholerae]QKU77317.1 hypothetical protein HPY05_20725 [Vibrio cholerae]